MTQFKQDSLNHFNDYWFASKLIAISQTMRKTKKKVVQDEINQEKFKMHPNAIKTVIYKQYSE